jgi:hypothetical protein
LGFATNVDPSWQISFCIWYTVIVAYVGRQCVLFLQSLQAFSVKNATPRGVELIKSQDLVQLSQQAVSAILSKIKLRPLTIFIDLKTCCTKGGPESKMHIMQNHFLFGKVFHRRTEFFNGSGRKA